MKAHNNGLHLHASSFSGSAMGIVENAARETFEGGAQVKPEPFSSLSEVHFQTRNHSIS